jgi:hypothetical protein
MPLTRLDFLDPELRPMVEEAERISAELNEEQRGRAAAGDQISRLEELRLIRSNFEVNLATALAEFETARRHDATPDGSRLIAHEAAVISYIEQMGWEATRTQRPDVVRELLDRIDRGKAWVEHDFERGGREGWAYRGEERDLLDRGEAWTAAVSRLLTKPEGWARADEPGFGAMLGRAVRRGYLTVSRRSS